MSGESPSSPVQRIVRPIRPCPFCGLIDELDIGCEYTGRSHGRAWIVCESCGTTGPSMDIKDTDVFKGIDHVAELTRWNRRRTGKRPNAALSGGLCHE